MSDKPDESESGSDKVVIGYRPVDQRPPPPQRARAEQILAHCPIYPLEVAHRKVPRKSYLG